MQRFNYEGRWYTLEQYQKLLNPVEEVIEEIKVELVEEEEKVEEVKSTKSTSKPKVNKSKKK